MRQYRGKRVDNGEWAYGWYDETEVCKPAGIIYTIHSPGKTYEVIPETVGQSTGLKDKNGKEIYEGDIIKTCNGNYPVSYLKLRPEFVAQYGQVYIDATNWKRHEVIGNIHENPELLESKS